MILFFSVDECKKMYRSMRDAVRYRRNKIPGKSGDSGGENVDDDEVDNWELKDALSFLTPTSSKFSRKTTVLGAGQSTSPEFDPLEDELARERESNPFELDEHSNQSSVYSYVRISFHFAFHIRKFVVMCDCCIKLCFK